MMKNKHLLSYLFIITAVPKLVFATCIGHEPDWYEKLADANTVTIPSVEIDAEKLYVFTGETVKLIANATVDIEQGANSHFLWCTRTGSFVKVISDYSTILFSAPSTVGKARIAVQVADGLGYAGINYIDLEVISSKHATFKGQVLNSENHPVADAKVSIGDENTVTDKNGNWSITGIFSEKNILVVEKIGFNFPMIEIIVGKTIEPLIITENGKTECQLYAVHDKDRNHSLFFTIDVLNNFDIKLLGTMYNEYDIESLAIHPTNNQLFAAAGKDGLNPGYLYTINANTGIIYPIGDTGFKDINGLSFKPDDGTLWAWTKNGLIQIDTTTAKGTLQLPYNGAIEDITWNNTGTVLYGVMNNTFLAYDNQTAKVLDCTVTGGEIEALEMMPGNADNELLFSMHNDNSLSIRSINIDSCEQAEAKISTAIEGIKLNDVEGIALPKEACIR